MDLSIQFVFVPLLVLLLAAVTLLFLGGTFYLLHFLLTAPMRRAERARFFLDLLEGSLERGQPVEESLVSVALSRDRSLGARFHLLTAHLASGLRLVEALERVPRLLPPQIVAMLKVGQHIGDLKKVLPACRQFLRDSLSETRSAVNYVVLLAFVVTPMSLFVFVMLCVKVMPVLRQISDGMGNSPPFLMRLVWEHFWFFVLAHVGLMAVLWFLAFIHAIGPRAVQWMPFLHRVYFRLPWRRKRMSRDFSVTLVALLDARVPETQAITLAAGCTSNRVFQRRAAHVAEKLKQGMKLTDAVSAMDDAGEFRWRLTNAAHATDGFRVALAGWHEALDAKAFQQEQAAAHGITTALVLLNGLFVGTVVTSVFGFLISIINAGILW